MGIKSRLRFIDDLVKEMYDDVVYSLYGESESGKTTKLLTLAYELMGGTLKGKNVCWYDSEGGAGHFVNLWDSVLRERFKVPKESKILVRRFTNIADILRDHGYGTKITDNKRDAEKDPDKGIKVMFFAWPLDSIQVTETENRKKKVVKEWKCEFEKWVEENNIGMIVYDSITRPMEFFGSNRQNFPARADATGAWIQGMFDVMERQHVIAWAIHHESIDPQDKYSKPKIRGGETLHYNSKVILYLQQVESAGMERWRRVKLKRYFNFDTLKKDDDPFNPAKLPTRFTELTRNGYEDREEEEFMKEYAKVKAERAKKK